MKTLLFLLIISHGHRYEISYQQAQQVQSLHNKTMNQALQTKQLRNVEVGDNILRVLKLMK